MARSLLALVLLGLPVLAACGGGGGGGGSPTAPPPPPAPKVVTIEVTDHNYNPRSAQVNPGDTVRWVMRGSEPGHSVTERTGAFDSGFVFTAPGAIYERAFGAGEEGRTYEYACATHAGCCNMRGSVRVGDAAPRPNPDYE
ncbi:MAG TPA: plastocyanin/azurin family copper-binding protein [Thermoanaerobaculia bacterium]|nr:plastocyanin/azurin family copper-binding protein [Thermoanaerobaculia bacterium]